MPRRFRGCGKKTLKNPIVRDMVYISHPIGRGLETTYDFGKESILTCGDILDSMAIHENSFITISFDKAFLRKIILSYLHTEQGI